MTTDETSKLMMACGALSGIAEKCVDKDANTQILEVEKIISTLVANYLRKGLIK